jgi:hypothetical protein
MRRDINWKTKTEEGDTYDVRVHWFAGEFKMQFKERGAEDWDYKRKPTLEDLETLVDAIQRRHQRRQATELELKVAEKMLADFVREHTRDPA